MTAAPATARWVCCHLGAREHYAVPRALHRRQRLRRLITDAWVTPGSTWSRLPGGWPRRLSERFHPDLSNADVQAFTLALMTREALWRARSGDWEQLMRRNRWFGRRAAAALQYVTDARGRGTIVFAHSYSAREVFTFAKSREWTTVLGQIDPGEEHFRAVARASADRPEYGPAPAPPPAAYFEAWREECRLADWIVVNSEWSRDSLVRAGVAPAKIRVVPLAYDPESGAEAAGREAPEAFSRERPLRLLFVGHAAVVKGAAALLEAVELLAEVPVELRMVGAIAMRIPDRFLNHPGITWIGPVPRSEVMRHYRESDVLVFPSLSDGFGMAQVEAQGWQLPIIASRSCGRVVQDELNGLLLAEPAPGEIAAAIRRVAADPTMLDRWSRHAPSARHARMAELGTALAALER